MEIKCFLTLSEPKTSDTVFQKIKILNHVPRVGQEYYIAGQIFVVSTSQGLIESEYFLLNDIAKCDFDVTLHSLNHKIAKSSIKALLKNNWEQLN